MVCKYMSDDAVTIMIFMKKPTKKEIAQISENHHVKYAMVIELRLISPTQASGFYAAFLIDKNID